LLRESLTALGAGDDAAGFQFLVDPPAGGFFHCGGSAHGAAGAVTGGAKGLLHASRLANEYPARAAPVARDDDWPADPAVNGWNLGVARREGACGPLAVDPDLLRVTADRVLFELGDVVADVIEQIHLHGLPSLPEHLGEHFARLLHEKLAIAPGEIGRRAHG